MTKDPRCLQLTEKNSKEWKTRAFTAIGKRTRETGDSHYTSYHTKTLQEHWGIQIYILIAQPKKKPDCSSLPALPTAINTSRCQKMFQTCPDQPSFWWELLQLSQDKGPLCADKPFTHTSYSLPLKGMIELLLNPEKMPGTIHTGRFGVFFPKKKKIKWKFTLANNASSAGWSVFCHVLYLSATSQNNLPIHLLPALEMHE